MTCPTCANPKWLGWTDGNKVDALTVARGFEVPTAVYRCAKGGWDVVAVVR